LYIILKFKLIFSFIIHNLLIHTVNLLFDFLILIFTILFILLLIEVFHFRFLIIITFKVVAFLLIIIFLEITAFYPQLHLEVFQQNKLAILKVELKFSQ